jgi:hypothetical protein
MWVRGDMSAAREFLGSAFWKVDTNGKSSVADTDMIDALRVLWQNGFPLSVFPLDVETENVSRRDVIMATHVRQEYETHITALKLTYSGTVHSMKKVPEWDCGQINVGGDRRVASCCNRITQ